MTKITESKSVKLGEIIWEVEHESGLGIIVYPIEGYATSCAVFGAKFGSINVNFKDANGKLVRVPEGTAHFLEHKMFENKDGRDAFELFAEIGANANAFTSLEETCYTFSTVAEFERNLEISL